MSLGINATMRPGVHVWVLTFSKNTADVQNRQAAGRRKISYVPRGNGVLGVYSRKLPTDMISSIQWTDIVLCYFVITRKHIYRSEIYVQ